MGGGAGSVRGKIGRSGCRSSCSSASSSAPGEEASLPGPRPDSRRCGDCRRLASRPRTGGRPRRCGDPGRWPARRRLGSSVRACWVRPRFLATAWWIRTSALRVDVRFQRDCDIVLVRRRTGHGLYLRVFAADWATSPASAPRSVSNPSTIYESQRLVLSIDSLLEPTRPSQHAKPSTPQSDLPSLVPRMVYSFPDKGGECHVRAERSHQRGIPSNS